MASSSDQQVSTSPEGLIRRAWMCAGGTVVALLLNGLWTLVVGTASFGADESDLVQGWEGVLRNLPAYILLVTLPMLGVWFATRAGVLGARSTKSALIATSLFLLFALNAVTRDAAEVVMTTRAATVTWVLFGIDLLVVIGIFVGANQQISKTSRK